MGRTEPLCNISQIESPPVFDGMFKHVVVIKEKPDYMNMIDWVNQNSHGAVDVRFVDIGPTNLIYFAFSDINDSLIFKIKFS
jgi:hypothetical protein